MGSPAKVILGFIGKASDSRTANTIPNAYLYFSEQLRSWLTGGLSGSKLSDKTQADYLNALWKVIKTHIQ